MQIEQIKVAIKEKELEIKLLEIQSVRQEKIERLNLDRELGTAKISTDLQIQTGKQAFDAEKFKSELAIKQQINPTANYGLE